ncbi:MAG: hypothetical protein V9G10_05735 [Candidatus Nanopelagicales bacterium]
MKPGLASLDHLRRLMQAGLLPDYPPTTDLERAAEADAERHLPLMFKRSQWDVVRALPGYRPAYAVRLAEFVHARGLAVSSVGYAGAFGSGAGRIPFDLCNDYDGSVGDAVALRLPGVRGLALVLLIQDWPDRNDPRAEYAGPAPCGRGKAAYLYYSPRAAQLRGFDVSAGERQ